MQFVGAEYKLSDMSEPVELPGEIDSMLSDQDESVDLDAFISSLAERGSKSK